MPKINSKDLRLLYNLDLNARDSFAQIGQRCGLSKETAANRIHALEESGVIRGYNVVFDIGQLGYTGYGTYLKLSSISDKKLEKLNVTLNKHPNVYWVAQAGGNFDLLVSTQAKSPLQLNTILEELQSEHPIIDSVAIAPRLSVAQFSRDYLLDGKSTRRVLKFTALLEPHEVDEVDRNILSELSEDSRRSVVDIAKNLGLARSTVQIHLKQLEDSGVIQGYTALIDATALDYESYVLLISLNHNTPAVRKQLFDYAKSNPHVINLIEQMGAWQIEMSCELPDQKALHHLIKDLRLRFEDDIASIDAQVCFDYLSKYRFGALT